VAGEHLDAVAVGEERGVDVDDLPREAVKNSGVRISIQPARTIRSGSKARSTPASRRSYAWRTAGSWRSERGNDMAGTPTAVARRSAPASARSLTTTTTSASSVPHAVASSSACRFVPEPEARTAIRGEGKGTRAFNLEFEFTLAGIPVTTRHRGATACRRTGSCPPPHRHAPPPRSGRRLFPRPRELGRRL
jgi:hypothetical protein